MIASPRSRRSLDARLIAELRSHPAARRQFLFTILAQSLSGLLVIAQAFVLSRIIDGVFHGQQSLADVTPLLLGTLAVVLARALLTFAGTNAAGELAVSMKQHLQGRALRHLPMLGAAFTRAERSGDLALSMTDGIEKLDGYFRDYLPAIVNALSLPLLILVVVLPIDLLTFFVLLITAPLIPLFMMLIGRAAGGLAKQQFMQMRLLGAHFLDVMQGLTTLKLFNRSAYQVETIQRITDAFRQATLRVLRVALLSAFMLELLATLSVAIVAVEIGVRLINGQIAFQPALFLLMLAPEYYLPLRTLGARFHNATEGKAAAERLYQVLDAPLPAVGSATAIPQRMHIRFENVHVAYEQGGRPALRGVSFALQPGTVTALVGVSGGGKSTLAHLLLRFIKPDAGTISVDGVDLETLAPDAWRQRVGWLSQSPYIFNGTIASNIAFSRPEASMGTVTEAAQRAGAHEFIMQFPQGYATACGERGLRLSGGQAQRIALARAFLRDAPLLILDEPTSQLDPESEAAIIRAVFQRPPGQTVLLIAHRLATVRQADQIVVLEGGTLVERGTPADLMAQRGHFFRLMQHYEGDSHAS
jgi:ATP-binding cassette subfamily C protein CydD